MEKNLKALREAAEACETQPWITLNATQQMLLVRIAADFHWMARRYCDGRSTYATGLFNDYTRALLRMGIKLNPTADRTLFASDSMGRAFDGLTEAEATPGTPGATGKLIGL